MTLYPGHIPVMMRSDEGAREEWGRFLGLFAGEAEVLSRSTLRRGDCAAVSFTLNGMPFQGVRAVVAGASRDGEGYTLLRLVWENPSDVQRLRESLLRLLR